MKRGQRLPLESPLAAAYPDLSLTCVVGEDAVGLVTARYGRAFGNRVAVLSWRDRSSLLALYAEHDILLFPSLFEGFGKTFLEAMACGLCVVGFNQGGLSDIARSEQSALICDTGDDASFKALIERCLQHPDAARAIGRRAQAVAQPYSWARTAEQTEAFCLRLRRDLLVQR